ncbi:unnamed protein product [Mesocestoides corti]|uniref:PDZ domain-containing protein n=1 Tax=Mesocestoides corti TaxID=53468 RepID=A0A158QSK2_MESCO|nr:unnamed protein product [Mesocestoides corti]
MLHIPIQFLDEQIQVMKKFTINSQLSDTDSGRFSGGATSSDSSFRVQDPCNALLIKISIPFLSKQVYASALSKALVNHVKQKLLDEFGNQITDSINYGLFIPPANGRNGKFLEEDRPISAYVTDESSCVLEAALLGRTDQINLLIMYGADVNARSHSRPEMDPPGRPALPRRTTKSQNSGTQSSATQLRLNQILGCGRETPLHYAAIAGQCATARRLLYWGADPTLTNDKGRTPVEEARLHGNHEVAEIIRNFRAGTGGGGKNFGASEGSICGPFLPAPTYNQKRKPMTAPLQISPLDDYVSLTVLGAERKGPSRSVTMPFPVSPVHINPAGADHSRLQSTLDGTTRRLSPTSTSSPYHGLRGRASSDGDLLRSLEEEEEEEGQEKARAGCGVQSSRERRNSRRTRRQRVARGYADCVKKNGRSLSQNCNRKCLKSWKSSHTLNEDSALEEEAADVMPAMPLRGGEFRFTSGQRGEDAARALRRSKTAPFANPCSERPRSSQDTSLTVGQFARRERISTGQTLGHQSQENAPIPTNPFCPVSVSPRPVSPRQRNSHHFARSPVKAGDLSGACSPTQSPAHADLVGGTSANREGGAGVARTVVLHKAYLPDAPRIPTLGLTLRTVQNTSAVQRFVPSQAKPSLQLIKQVKPASPAFNAGLREGDYVIKINHVDVSRACHTEVVNLLDTLKSNSVVLEVVRPIHAASCLRPQDAQGGRTNAPISCQGKIGPAPPRGVQRSVSMVGRFTHKNGPAPYSPMLPMPALQGRCVSPGESSVSSTDEAFCSQSVSRTSSLITSPPPQAVDRRTSNRGANPPPYVHTPADYRIRHQFPTATYAVASRQKLLPDKASLRQMQKSHTINSFSESVGVDTSSLSSNTAASVSLSPPTRHNLQSFYANNRPTSTGRPVHSVPQPPLRFLPHYSSPIRGVQETGRLRRRDKGARHFTDHVRPLSMTSDGGGVSPTVNAGSAAVKGGVPRSSSAMSANTPPPQGGSFDPNDLVLPPPEEFCC